MGIQNRPDLVSIKAKAKELKAQGVPISKIAEMLGVSVGSANYYIYGSGKLRERPKVDAAAVAAAKVDKRMKPDTLELMAKVTAMKEQGYSYSEMAPKLGISKSRAGYLGSLLKRQREKAVAVPAATPVNGHAPAHDHDFDRHAAYAAGHVSAWLEIYADSLRVPRQALTEQVIGALKARNR